MITSKQRHDHAGHWTAFFRDRLNANFHPEPAAEFADNALEILLERIPQLARPAEIEPHGSPDFPTTNTPQVEAAPDGPFVNEESASSPRPHPAALSKLVAAAAEARDYLDGCSDLLDGMGAEAGCGSVWRALNAALKPFADDDITQPDTAVS